MHSQKITVNVGKLDGSNPLIMRKTALILGLLVVLLQEAYSLKPLSPLEALAGGQYAYTEQRQSAGLNHDEYCLILQIQQQCKGGIVQQAVDVALSCGEDSLANTIALSCLSNEKGVFCVEAAFRLMPDPFDVPYSCHESVTSCEPSCREFLEAIVSSLGCCGFSLYNETLTNAELWNLCGVDIPAKCTSDLEVNIPSVVDTCTWEEFLSRLFELQCKPSNGQPIVDELVKQNCTSLARSMVEGCGTNADGEICAVKEILDYSRPIDNDLYTECRTSQKSCNASCRDFIEDVIDSHGCCVNVYNNSGYDGELTSLSYEVWKSCGYEEDTGACTENTLNLTSPSPEPGSERGLGTEVKAFAMLVLTAVLLIQEAVMH